MAGAVPCDIPICFIARRKSFFFVASAILLHRLQKMSCIFRGQRSTSDVSCCVVVANPIVRAPRSGDKVQIPWQTLHFEICDEN